MPSISMMLTSTLALLSSVALAAPVHEHEKRADCSTPVRVITVRGSNEIYGKSSLQVTYKAILAQGVRSQLQGVPYPAALDWNNNAVEEASQATGQTMLINIVTQAAKQCPNQKLVLLGYSQGAQVVGGATCGNPFAAGGAVIPDWAASKIAAVVLFGDPSHIMGQSFVRDNPTGNGMVPRYFNSQCDPYTGRIASFCHATDPVCSNGGDWNQHGTYQAMDANAAAAWVASKVK